MTLTVNGQPASPGCVVRLEIDWASESVDGIKATWEMT